MINEESEKSDDGTVDSRMLYDSPRDDLPPERLSRHRALLLVSKEFEKGIEAIKDKNSKVRDLMNKKLVLPGIESELYHLSLIHI